jgi:hypothetical protein
MKTLHLLSISFLFLCSCSSNGLSRQKAANLISQQQGLPSTQTVRVFSKYLKRSWSNPTSGFAAITICNYSGETFSDVQQRLTEWQSKGVVSLGESTDGGDCPALWVTVSLTNEGKKYLVRESGGGYEVKGYDLAFGEVTGIQINEQFKSAEADYTLRQVNMTAFGSSASGAPIRRRASFALFDDGWRMR